MSGKSEASAFATSAAGVASSHARAFRYARMNRRAMSVWSHARVAARLEKATGPIACPTEATTWPTRSCSSCWGAGPCW